MPWGLERAIQGDKNRSLVNRSLLCPMGGSKDNLSWARPLIQVLLGT